jgi:protein required for attachment to host cells
MLSGTADLNQIEKNRLRDFANVVVKRLGLVVREQKIQEIHLSAPAKFLSVMKTHLTKELTKIVRTTLDGNFVKEPVKDVLLRFRPDMVEAVKSLKEQENYSMRKQPPRK